MSLQAQKTVPDGWVDSVYQSLSDTQRLGQLFIIRAQSNLGTDHEAQVEDLIQRFQVGGLCFFQGTPEKQLELTNRYQALAKVPLFISMDAEWGLNMRLKDAAIAYPKQLMLGAIQDNTLIYKFGQAVAKDCRRLGVHINFAPVADVNNNPNNPVINDRSFGEDKRNVAAKCFQYMLGMQDNGVMACAKHFPGHGDTDVDSHFDLPVVNKDMASLNDLELMPFRVLSQQGIESFMIGHLQIPSIDNAANMPTSLSKNAVRNLLRTQIGYKGLIFTDGLEMKGVTKYYYNGEAEARALEAGCDLLCVPENVPASFAAIKRYMDEGKIDPKTNTYEEFDAALTKLENAGVTSAMVCVDAENACGKSDTICKSVDVAKIPTPLSISGEGTVCPNTIGSYSVTATANVTTYQWSVTNGTIASGQGTPNLAVSWGASTTGRVCFTPTNRCGAGTQTCFDVQISNSPPDSLPIQGNTTVCSNDTSVFSINISGSMQFNWEVPTGATLLRGQATNTILVLWGNLLGNTMIGLTMTNGCNLTRRVTSSINVKN